MNKSEIARSYFMSGCNCSQSVLTAFAEETGLSPDITLRIADGFGAGMGRTQEVCGAVTGGIMVIGLLFGKGAGETHEEKGILYARIRHFMEAFGKAYGSVNCKQLLNGCDLLTLEGQATFKERNLRDTCAGFVASACEILTKEIALNTTE